jgi:hypothetical protein
MDSLTLDWIDLKATIGDWGAAALHTAVFQRGSHCAIRPRWRLHRLA